MKDKKVAIIGLGLIGGSLARALREKAGIIDITAVDSCMESIRRAIEDGCICRGFDSINEYVWNSDVIFICTPAKYVAGYIKMISTKADKNCIITDVGSTKSEIIDFVNSIEGVPCFIGGHPMAGSEKEGYMEGSVELFENASYILTPSNSTTSRGMELMCGLIRTIGAVPFILNHNEHDRIVGGISHLPHIIASALVNLVKQMENPRGDVKALVGGGFRDITRIASANPEMWKDIILSNRHWIIQSLDSYIEILEKIKKRISKGEANKVYGFFESAMAYRNSCNTAEYIKVKK